jgi:hypothetical protein
MDTKVKCSYCGHKCSRPRNSAFRTCTKCDRIILLNYRFAVRAIFEERRPLNYHDLWGLLFTGAGIATILITGLLGAIYPKSVLMFQAGLPVAFTLLAISISLVGWDGIHSIRTKIDNSTGFTAISPRAVRRVFRQS